jgi:transposase
MALELRIRIDVTIPWPENRVDSAAQSIVWDNMMGAFIKDVETLAGHLHATAKGPVRARNRKAMGTADEARGVLADEAAPHLPFAPADQPQQKPPAVQPHQTATDYFGPLPPYLTNAAKGVGT